MVKTVIKNTASGTIELLCEEPGYDGRQLILQFNCDCLDAISMCHAACCRYRPFYNVGLEPEEVEKYQTESHPENEDLQILNYVDGHCIYLQNNSLCEVHDDKPCICKRWHCSPRGGQGIEQRDGGWILLPFKHLKKSDTDGH